MSEVRIKGLNELSKKLDELSAETGAKVLRQSLMLAATPLVKDARLRIPVGDEAHRSYKGNILTPGFARRSIKKASSIRDGVARVSVGVKREAYYATAFVELGTEKMRAQPWLVPAFKAQRTNVENRLKEQLKKKIAKVTK